MRRTTRRAGRHATRLVVVVATVMTLLGAHANPAGAGGGSQIGQGVRGACPASGGYYTVIGRAYMVEYGKSGVSRLKAKFKLYRTNETGLHIPRLEKTYRSPRFPNDNSTYGQWLPYTDYHRWADVYGTNEYRLDVKETWERKWRPDWNYQTPVVYCAGGGI